MAQELFKLVGKVVIDNDAAKKEIQNTTEQAESGSGRMQSTFKKLGTAVAAAFAVDKVIEFGKACVESAAEVQAQNAQFEATFGDLQSAAQEAFDRVGQSTGILSTRLQTEGTKAFSMFKGAGMDANTALEETEKFMELAADAAAYYDISLEDASARVLGFAKGNFENGDAIGVFTNETQRNSIAMEKYGKKYTELTEAQKQMLALDMIGNTYELSGALGQASREADGYENVMGNLKEAWRQFTAIIGTPILAAVIPIVKSLTTGLSQMGTWVQQLGTWVSDLWTSFTQGETAKGVFDRLQMTVNVLSNAWNMIFPTLQTLWNSFVTTIQVAWDNIGRPIFDFIVSIVTDVWDAFNNYFPAIAEIVDSIFTLISNYWNTVLQPALKAIGAFIQGTLLPIWNTVWGVIKTVISTVFNFIVDLWWGTLQPVFQGIIDFLGGVFSGNWSQVWEGIKGILSGVWNGIKTIVQTAINIVSTIITTVWNTIKSITTTVWNTIKTAISTPINAAKDTVSNVINTIKDTVSNVFNTVKDTVTNVWNKIKESITKPINDAKDKVKGIVDTIKGFFNFNISWPHIPLPHFAIKPKGWSIGDLLKGKIPSLGIDWYAKGGVFDEPTIFPTAQGFKGVGEAGPEAVTPINVLQDYVRDAVSEQTGGLYQVMEKIYRLLKDYVPNLGNDIVLDTGVLVGELAQPMDERLGKIKDRKGRRK